MQRRVLVVVKSTVPVGTCDAVRETIARSLAQRDAVIEFDVASNPEFLAEGRAVEDFMRPDRIIIGVNSEASEKKLRALYGPFNRNHEKILAMDVKSSELTKYAANAMLATKISLMNEIANIAESVGADVEHVRRGIGSDPRIGYAFIYPGPGYGGSCFPKDVRALAHTAQRAGVEPRMLDAVEAVNDRQKRKLFELLTAHFGGDLDGVQVAVWGLAFKPGTDDLREAPSLVLIDQLLQAGAKVRAHDPEAMEHAMQRYPESQAIDFCADPMDAARDADALVLVTEWKQYWVPDFAVLGEIMRQKILFDGRNVWSREAMAEQGFTCHSIGRPALFPAAPA
jgi:UDPglucose 6-dehydrogenase